jgi:hypothetical protein
MSIEIRVTENFVDEVRGQLDSNLKTEPESHYVFNCG